MKITDVKVETIRIPMKKAIPYCFLRYRIIR